MNIVTTGKNAFLLLQEDGSFAGSLVFNSEDFSNALLITDVEYIIETEGSGRWITKNKDSGLQNAQYVVELDGRIKLEIGEKQFMFIKPVSWKPRFFLKNSQQEEVAAFLPSVNWKLESYNFSLQLNDEFSKEMGAFIILQALHCAVCSMAMLSGVVVPIIGEIKVKTDD
jgi:hypothetical protein